MWPLNAQLAIEVFGYGGFIPAAVSLAMVFAVRRILPNSASKRYAAALGLGTAFFVGYALLPEQVHASLRPQRYWHWLPYLGAVAMMAGPVGLAHGLLAMERWLMQLMLALLAACLLVPTWDSLQPPRTVCIPLLTSYFFVLMTALAPLPALISARLFQSLLAVVALCVAGMIWALVSETTGRVAAVAAAGMMGVCVSSFFSTAQNTARGLVPVFTILVGGSAFVGTIQPAPPLTGMLLAPAAPLALWICVRGPLARLRGAGASAAQTIAVLITLAIAVVIVLRSVGLDGY